MATSWTAKSKNSTSFTNKLKSDAPVVNTAGSPQGLLLGLTYPNTVIGDPTTTWTPQSKSLGTGVLITQGTTMGLLLALTYGEDVTGTAEITWTNQNISD